MLRASAYPGRAELLEELLDGFRDGWYLRACPHRIFAVPRHPMMLCRLCLRLLQADRRPRTKPHLDTLAASGNTQPLTEVHPPFPGHMHEQPGAVADIMAAWLKMPQTVVRHPTAAVHGFHQQHLEQRRVVRQGMHVCSVLQQLVAVDEQRFSAVLPYYGFRQKHLEQHGVVRQDMHVRSAPQPPVTVDQQGLGAVASDDRFHQKHLECHRIVRQRIHIRSRPQLSHRWQLPMPDDVASIPYRLHRHDLFLPLYVGSPPPSRRNDGPAGHQPPPGTTHDARLDAMESRCPKRPFAMAPASPGMTPPFMRP